ncbi:MAG: pentapeptide repeat-containing protein [Rhizonema sp. PD37]|nr:pentapeptide repeat-containing protein [Rhizonema sp. PD37]
MPQNYSGKNLRGRSFRGKNLEGANFSGADIRSADFSGANLTGANFSNARLGLQRRWAIFLVLISWVLMSISGFLSAIAGYFVAALIFQPAKGSEIAYQTAGFAVVIILIIFCFVTTRQGIQAGLRAGAGALALAVAGALVFTFARAVAGALAFAVAFAGAFAVAFAGTFAVAFAGTFAVAFAFAFAGAFAFAFAFAFAGALVIVLFSTYIGWRAFKGDPKHALIRDIAVAFAAIRGTSFRKANLSNANFSAVTLKSTDFRLAILTRTNFHKTKKLDRVRPGTTYLQKAQVREVLVTGEVQDKNFDRQDLRGVNFKRANLVDASFISADLSEANLQDADLSKANLVQAQLDGTDFTGAILTGAYIKDWNITSNTKFDRVRCKYVYMRLLTKENSNLLRKPDNNLEVFKDGEFGDFIKPLVDTLDLYHNQGVDPRAIAISFKQLAENHPEAELRIVGMEVKGEDKFLLRAKTVDIADKSSLSQEYFEIYNELKALAQQELKALISEKDSRILSLENMVETVLKRPSFYSNVEQVGFMTNNPDGISQNVSGGTMHGGMQASQGNNNTQNQGDTTGSDGRNINTGGGNYNERIQGNYVQGNYYAAQRQSLAEAATEIQTLLERLDKSYPTDTTAGKMAIATQAIEYIDSDPTLTQRVLSALKAGGVQALAQFLNHPAASFVIGALEDWQKTKSS